MSIESRPKVYFPTMTKGEIVNYAESYAETELEKALLEKLDYDTDKGEAEEKTCGKLDDMKYAGEQLVKVVRDVAHNIIDDELTEKLF